MNRHSIAVLAARTLPGLLLALSTSVDLPSHAQSGSYNSNMQGQERGAAGMVVNWNQQGQLIVTKVVAGGPAGKAGVSVGDRVVSIDGQAVQGVAPGQILQKLVGMAGTTTNLSLWSVQKGNYKASITRVKASELKKISSFKVGWQDNNSAPANTSASQPAQSQNTSWKTYGSKDQGFSLSYPNGWSVNQNDKTGKIEMNSPSGCKLSIFPFYLPSNSVNASKARGLFEAMLKQYSPTNSWTNPVLVTGALRSTSTSNNMNSVAGLTVAPMGNGTAGRLIVFNAPNTPQAVKDFGALAQILNSVKITGGLTNGGGGNQDNSMANGMGANVQPYQNIQFTKFVDPNFRSFSLDVPAGWNVEGAMKKPMPVDLRPWVRAISPDQKMIVFIGDGSIEPRYLPANWLTWMGCPPGSTYKVSTGLVTKVLYYQRADKFAKNYAKSRLGKLCQSFQLVDVQHHPDLARSINGTQGVVASDAASVKYTFNTNGTNGVAYFLCATKKGTKMWWVSQICGVLAAEGCEQQALEVFLRMYRSWQYNPQWTQAQNRQNVISTQNFIARDRAARLQSARAFNARMAAMDARHNAYMARSRAMDAAHSSYMNRMRASDRSHSNFINFIRDEETMMDPNTGTKYQVEFGPKYHWVNSRGDTTISTDSAWSPGVDYTELVAPPKPY